MKKFLYQIISAGHHGRAAKHSRRGRYDLALESYQRALDYAKRSDNESAIPIELECIARTLVRLKEYEQAKKYAVDGLGIYRKMQEVGEVFRAGITRTEELLKEIEEKKTI